MENERSAKFQWISIVYLLLFTLAVFSPSMVGGDIFGLPEQHIEEFLIFVFGLAGISIFMLYERMMEKAEKEHVKVVDACEHAKRELVSSYQYIGSLNRQMEILKQISNDTSISIYEQDKLSKDLLSSLVMTASGSLGGVPALLRIVELNKLRTEHEVYLPHNGSNERRDEGRNHSEGFRVPNKELHRIHNERSAFAYFENDGKKYLVVPSDRVTGRRKVFIVLVPQGEVPDQFDPTVLKVFANQAELIYRALKKGEEPIEAIQLVEQATEQTMGEVT